MHIALLIAVLVQVPSDYQAAEAAARLALEKLGVSTQGVRVVYDGSLPKDVNGQQKGDLIRINTHRYPESVKSVYHEFWHYYQQQRLGGEARFSELYSKFPYDANPFETEARYAADVMEHAHRMSSSLLFRMMGRSYEKSVVEQLEKARPKMEEFWKGSTVAPEHLTKPTIADRAASLVKREAAGMATFAAAYLLKEAMKGRLATEVATPAFWGDVGAFTVAARVAEHGVVRLGGGSLARTALPLAAGMAAVQLLHGKASLKDVLIDTASFVAAGWAVGAIADGLIYPVLFAAGPPGWVAAGVYTVAKLAVSLYAGEKLSAFLHGLFDGRATKVATPETREGIKQKIDALAEP